MGKIPIFFLCIALLTGAVFADNQTDQVRSTVTVATDGSAQVVQTVVIHVEEAGSGLTYPVPKGAINVTLDEALVTTSPSQINHSVDLVSLSHLDGFTGTKTLTVSYTLPAVITYEPLEQKAAQQETTETAGAETEASQEEPHKKEMPEGVYTLLVPLLSGFEFPVRSMEFTIQLPEGAEGIPNFYSGYFLQSIESNLNYKMENGTIAGTVTTQLKDKETLHMEMVVNPEDFPDLVIVENQDYLHWFVMLGAAVVALVFWLIFLPSLPVIPKRRSMPPVGVHAGELGSRLTMEGGDLTMMVFHWAQLGYIRIIPDKRERVWLHKRMEMGNERSEFENKCFRQLFGRNQSVEGTGSRYGRLWLMVHHTLNDAQEITKGGLWARGGFRFLAMLVSTLAGVAMGLNLVEDAPWMYVAAVGFGLLGSLTGWKIQAGTMKLHLRLREGRAMATVCCVLWLAAGFFTDLLLEAAASALFQLLAGIFTAWGGRRTPQGRKMACKVLGLRHYLKGIKHEEVKEELERNPDYFFEMAPYAMALGVDNAFDNRFGGRIMPPCSYLDADRTLRRTARGWIYLMQTTAQKMDAAGKRAKKYRRK